MGLSERQDTLESLENVKKKQKNAFNGHRLLANLKRTCETNTSILINDNSTKYEK